MKLRVYFYIQHKFVYTFPNECIIVYTFPWSTHFYMQFIPYYTQFYKQVLAKNWIAISGKDWKKHPKYNSN